MRSTEKDIGGKKTNHSAVPMKWSMLKFFRLPVECIDSRVFPYNPSGKKRDGTNDSCSGERKKLQKRQRSKMGDRIFPY